MIVVDVNVTAYFFIEGEKTELARALRRSDSDWVLPPLWRHEFLNVLATFVRAGGASIGQAQSLYAQSIEMLGDAERDVDMAQALGLASLHDISAYDAQYVALAQQLSAVCVSEDRRLQRTFPDIICGMRAFLDRGTEGR